MVDANKRLKTFQALGFAVCGVSDLFPVHLSTGNVIARCLPFAKWMKIAPCRLVCFNLRADVVGPISLMTSRPTCAIERLGIYVTK